MKNVYPVFIREQDKDFLVYVPDLDIYTEGKDLADAIGMARDAIGLKGIDYEDDYKTLPVPSSVEQAVTKAKENNSDFDYSKGIVTLVDVDFTEYRRMLENRSVKKNCTIPYRLNAEAEKQCINFSKVLQDALTKILYTKQ